MVGTLKLSSMIKERSILKSFTKVQSLCIQTMCMSSLRDKHWVSSLGVFNLLMLNYVRDLHSIVCLIKHTGGLLK